MIRILLADHHRLLHPSIRAILSTTDDLMLIGEVTDSDKLRQNCQQENQPDLLLFSPNVVPSSTAKILDDIRESCPSIKILVMLSHSEEASSQQLVAQGVAGIILKSDPPDRLLEAIYTTAQGRSWFSAELAAKLIQSQQPNLRNSVTDREMEILQLLVAEKTNIEISRALSIAERTVRSHLESIYGKLGVESRAGAVAKAIRLNLIS